MTPGCVPTLRVSAAPSVQSWWVRDAASLPGPGRDCHGVSCPGRGGWLGAGAAPASTASGSVASAFPSVDSGAPCSRPWMCSGDKRAEEGPQSCPLPHPHQVLEGEVTGAIGRAGREGAEGPWRGGDPELGQGSTRHGRGSRLRLRRSFQAPQPQTLGPLVPCTCHTSSPLTVNPKGPQEEGRGSLPGLPTGMHPPQKPWGLMFRGSPVPTLHPNTLSAPHTWVPAEWTSGA